MQSLEQIILAQQDEPNQKNCVYSVKFDEPAGNRNDEEAIGQVEKFFQVRVKSLEFLQKKATAVYFYDVTKCFLSMELSG